MKREIRFRVWDEIDLVMREVALLKWDNGYDLARVAGWIAPCPGVGYHQAWRDAEPPHRYKLMQFTGLRDKNGVEIYEGDVVEFVGGTTTRLSCGTYADEFHSVGKRLAVVALLSGFTLMQFHHLEKDTPNLVGNVDNYDLWNHARSFTVIGNIYENSDLVSPAPDSNSDRGKGDEIVNEQTASLA